MSASIIPSAAPAGSFERAARVAEPPKPPRSWRPSGWHLLLLPLALVMLLPFLWLLVTSLQTLAESRTFPPSLPHGFPAQWWHNAVHNYSNVWRTAPFGRWFMNTTIVSVSSVLGNLVFCSLAGYALARIRFFGNGTLFLVILATLMVPFQVVMVPTLLIVRGLGLTDTLGALIAPNLVTPFGIFLLRQFFKTMPVELEEAARIDGASRLGTIFKVVLPLMKAPLATVGIMTLLWSWNDFLWPLIAIQTPSHMTLQLGLQSFSGAHATDWPTLMAATVLTQLPMLAIFIVAQRWFVQSLASSGLKQ